MFNFIEGFLSMDLLLLKVLPVGTSTYSESNRGFYTLWESPEGEKFWVDGAMRRYLHLPFDAVYFDKTKEE